MGLGMWAASVVDAGVRHMGGGGAGLGGPAAGEVRARYLIMAGSTSAVYWRKRIPLRTLRCEYTRVFTLDAFLPSHPLWCVDGRQCIQVCHWELNAFPLQFLINVDHTS